MPVTFARPLILVALMLAWTIPYAIVNHTYPIPTFYAEFAALSLYLSLAAAAALLVWRSREPLAFDAPRVAVVPLCLALLLLFQTVLLPTSQPTLNLLGAGFLLAAYVAAHTGFLVQRAGTRTAALVCGAGALAAGGVFEVFCQGVQLWHLESRFAPFVVAYNVMTQRRPFGNMAQANHLATYLLFAMTAVLFLAQTRRLPLLVWAVLTAVFAAGEALTVSRGPWLQTLIVVLGGFAMALTARRARGLRDGARPWLVPALLLLIFVVVNIAVRWADLHWHWQLAVSAADRFREASQISPRLALWTYGWNMFKLHPWLGVGWGEFPRYQYQLAEKLGHVEIANNSHNILIDLLAKTGVAGLAIVLLGLGAWLWRVLRVRGGTTSVFCLTLLGVLGVHALVEYPQQYMFFLLPAAFVIGLSEPAAARYVPPAFARAAYALLIVAGGAALYPVYRDYRRGEVLYYGSDPEAQYRAAPSMIFGAWGQYGLTTLLPLDAPGLAAKLAMHRQAINLLPGETVVRRYAILLALAGRNAEALDNVRRLKVFAEELNDWPTQLASLYQACDQQPATLGKFRTALLARFGPAPRGAAAEDDDTDDDDNGASD